MRNFCFIIILCAFTCPWRCFGADSCALIFEPNVIQPMTVRFLDNRDAGGQAAVNELFNSIGDTVGTLAPSDISVGTVAKLADSNFRNGVLNVPDLPKAGIQASSAVIAHEFGHAIFKRFFNGPISRLQYFGKTVSIGEYADVVGVQTEELVTLAQRSERGDREVLKSRWLEFIHEPVDPEASKFAISGLFGRLRARIQQNVQSLSWEMLVYDELFADLVAVLQLNRPSAMADATGYGTIAPFFQPGESQFSKIPSARARNPDAGRPRDFATKISFKKWNREDSNLGMSGWYTLLDPVRGALWPLIKTKMSPLASNQDILEIYLQTTATELTRRMNSLDQAMGKESDVSALNKEFLKTFVREAKRRGLWRSQAGN